MGKPLFKYVEGERLTCPKCGGVMFIVDYRRLVKPKKGKRDKGFFGTCVLCGFWNRISSGHPQ
jgi:hypothetical protein